MIKNIIFDIGGVLTTLHFADKLETFPWSDEVKKRVEMATFRNLIWNQLDIGLLDTSQVIDAMVEVDPGVEQEIRTYMQDFRGCLKKAPYADAWLSALRKKGYKLYFLSNWSYRASRDFWNEIDFLRYMDGGIFSYQEKVIKPDAAIYQLLCQRFHLQPAECIFFDDLKRNVEGAKAVGIHSLHFTTKEAANAYLASFSTSDPDN